MTPPSEGDLIAARARAKRAWRRAAQAQQRAARCALKATAGPLELRELYGGLAASHEQVAERHRASARLQSSYADQLQSYLDPWGRAGSLPRFLTSIAHVVGAESVAVTLWGRPETVAAAMATDARARDAQEIELLVGEGPAHATIGLRDPLAVEETGFVRSWPQFARGAADLGVHVLAAAPLHRDGTSLGALTVFDPPWPAVASRLDQLQSVADALVESLGEDLWSADKLDEATARSPLLAEDRTAVIHQAAGIVSLTSGCDIDSALALIRARAFADDVDCTVLGAEIVAGRLRLRP